MAFGRKKESLIINNFIDMYKIIQKRKIWLAFSGTLVVFSVVAIMLWGLRFGIDFTGGSLMEVKFLKNKPSVAEVSSALAGLNTGSLVIQPVGENGMVLRFQDTSEEKHQEVFKKLNDLSADKDAKGEPVKIKIGGDESKNIAVTAVVNNVEELRYDAVGPTVGKELRSKSVTAIFFVIIAILSYIAWSFRGVSKPVASWKYGVAAILALVHDVVITVGIFAFLGKYMNIEINTPFVAAILTILGYSVSDTIVVFDRIRENLPKSHEDFESTINNSINQTIVRSINTSFTVLLALLSILFLGGSSIRDFALALSIGVVFGTYSSIFLASPILVLWHNFTKRKA